jgi:hypothetical protein
VRALGCIVFISDVTFRFNNSLIRWFGTKADATQIHKKKTNDKSQYKIRKASGKESRLIWGRTVALDMQTQT